VKKAKAIFSVHLVNKKERKLTEQIILNRNVSFPEKKGLMSIFRQSSSSSWRAYSVQL